MKKNGAKLKLFFIFSLLFLAVGATAFLVSVPPKTKAVAGAYHYEQKWCAAEAFMGVVYFSNVDSTYWNDTSWPWNTNRLAYPGLLLRNFRPLDENNKFALCDTTQGLRYGRPKDEVDNANKFNGNDFEGTIKRGVTDEISLFPGTVTNEGFVTGWVVTGNL